MIRMLLSMKQMGNAVNNILDMCFLSKCVFCFIKTLNHYQKSIFNPVGLETHTRDALSHLQYNIVRLHIYSTGIFLCWQSLLLEPRSLFRFPQLRPEGSLHLALLCSIHCSPPLCSLSVRVGVGKRLCQIESFAVGFRNPFYRVWDPP